MSYNVPSIKPLPVEHALGEPVTGGLSPVDPVLAVDDLTLTFRGRRTGTNVLNHVSFAIAQGEILGLVGESGSGKSVTALAIAKLLPKETAVFDSGTIRFLGANVLQLSEKQMTGLRGSKIGFVFQEPMTALNPTMTIGKQLFHVIRRHQHCTRAEAQQKALAALAEVLIPRPELVARQYPFELSGGMRQRVVIALAMSANPALLIADEPTTALDVTVQAEILHLIQTLARKHNTAVLLITHDLGVVARTCQRVVVLYAGEVVETGSVKDVLKDPSHPYAKALLQALPDIASPGAGLQSIDGELPDLRHRPAGCIFAPRCAFRHDKCAERPPLLSADGGRPAADTQHQAACWLVDGGDGHE